MVTYANSKNYLLLCAAGVMVQGCVTYVDPYPETIVPTRSQSVFETRPPFYGFDVFYDYYDRPYYLDSYRRVIYVETKYYPYVKSHYPHRKTDYGRHGEDRDDNHRETYRHDQPRVIKDHRDDDRRDTHSHDQLKVIEKHDDNRRFTPPQNQPRVIEKHDDDHRVTSPHDQPRFIDKRDDNRGRGNPNEMSKPNHVDNTIVNHSKDTDDKKNAPILKNTGRFNQNSDNNNNNHSNESRRTY